MHRHIYTYTCMYTWIRFCAIQGPEPAVPLPPPRPQTGKGDGGPGRNPIHRAITTEGVGDLQEGSFVNILRPQLLLSSLQCAVRPFLRSLAETRRQHIPTTSVTLRLLGKAYFYLAWFLIFLRGQTFQQITVLSYVYNFVCMCFCTCV